ncbi:ABC transporter ATP-binding protein, partial [Candidatus Atribacteria bacterium HGW-Atribacteria-1]
EECEKAVTGLGVRVRSPNEFVSILSGGERQAISIGRAMHFKVKLLIFDKPLMVLSVRETREVLRQVEKARESGFQLFLSLTMFIMFILLRKDL